MKKTKMEERKKAKTSVCRESVCQVSCTVSHLVHAALFGTGQEKGSIIPTFCHLLYYSLSSLFIIGHPLRTQVLNEIKTGKHSHLHGPARAAWRKKEAHYLLWCGLLRQMAHWDSEQRLKHTNLCTHTLRLWRIEHSGVVCHRNDTVQRRQLQKIELRGRVAEGRDQRGPANPSILLLSARGHKLWQNRCSAPPPYTHIHTHPVCIAS